MRHKKPSFLLAALWSVAALGACHAAPAKPAKTPVKTTERGAEADVIRADGLKSISANAVINETTRNDKKSQSALVLADDGDAKVPIIISDKASDATKAVAADLASLLQRIAGGKFEVKPGDGTSGIVLGNIKEFPTPALNEALKIYKGFDGREAYAIRTTGRRVLLLGATDLAASHAAYRFLREVGYRSFFPDKVWEVVPDKETLSFARDITDRPEILSRDIWMEAGSGSAQANEDYKDWKRRNAHAQSFVSEAGHILFVVPGMFPEEFKAHPEYYAQTADGKPILDDLELTNPAVRKLIVEYARRHFKERPNADMVSIDPTDRPGHSQSPEALKTPYSDQIFGVANEVARMLQKEFPGKMVGLYSYSGHWDPPTFKLEPNVHVLMSGLGGGRYTPAERDKIWPTRSTNRGAYEYYGVFLWSKDKLPGSMGRVEDLQKGLQHYSAHGVNAISAESTSNWGINGRAYMTANALMWNSHLDLKAYLDDFYTKAFGPGAPAMKRYFNRLVDSPFVSKQLIGQAFRDIDEASNLAKDRPDVQARLDFIKLYLRYGYLEWAQNRDGKQGLGDEIAELYGRNANRAIFTFSMAAQTWWWGKDFSGAEYQKPYTRAEIEKGFQEGLNYFPVRTDIGEPIKYSSDLVPITWTAAQKGTHTLVTQKDDKGVDKGLFQNYQGGVRYALYSVKGEPLEFSTYAGNAYGSINRLSIVDSKGVEVFKKDKIPNLETTKHRIAVAAPGLYWLDYQDNGSYWTMFTPDGLITSIPLGQTQDYRNMHYVPAQMFFYVPKGLKSIQYYYTRTAFHPGGPHKVVDPNGKVVKEVDVNGDWVSVPVPAGMDGKVWGFQNPVLGIFNFNNLPNLYAPTPDGILVPREVAVKDGLAIRK